MICSLKYKITGNHRYLGVNIIDVHWTSVTGREVVPYIRSILGLVIFKHKLRAYRVEWFRCKKVMQMVDRTDASEI